MSNLTNQQVPTAVLIEPGSQSKLQRALRLPQVREITGLGRSMIYQMQAENHFPRSIRLGERSAGWLQSEVRDWLTRRVSASRSGPQYSNARVRRTRS
ncbi:MAG: AlpA family transcriptional regulator [Proteobacteria bacterium]|nr:AlpA family transcriptional regulator [Pseudomonadota bacterium]